MRRFKKMVSSENLSMDDQSTRRLVVRSEKVAREASEKRRDLGVLYDLLHSLYKETQRASRIYNGHFVLWDWDVIESYITYEERSHLYAGALHGAVELSKKLGQDFRILLGEGTQMEMATYAESAAHKGRLVEDQTRRNITSSLNSISQCDQPQIVNEEFDVTPPDLALRRLSSFISSNTDPISSIADQIDSFDATHLRRTDEYQAIYAQLKHERGARSADDADSLNLATVRILRDFGYNATLVTRTGVLLRVFSDCAIHPLRFLASHFLRENVPDAEIRERRLFQWIAHTTKLIAGYQSIGDEIRATRQISIQSLENYRHILDIFQSDVILTPFLDILSKAYVYAQTQLEQLDIQYQKEQILLDESGVNRTQFTSKSLTTYLDSVLQTSNRNLRSLGYGWQRSSSNAQSVVKFELLEPHGRKSVLTCEATINTRTGTNETLYSLYWEVSHSPREFLLCLETILKKRQVQRQSALVIEMLREPSRPNEQPQGNSVITSRILESPAANEEWDLLNRSGFKYGIQTIGIRVKAKDVIIYYELGDLKLSTYPIIAVVDKDPHFSWFSAIHRSTANHRLPTETLKDELADLLKFER
jgi:hypothetical protein